MYVLSHFYIMVRFSSDLHERLVGLHRESLFIGVHSDAAASAIDPHLGVGLGSLLLQDISVIVT